MWNLSRSASNKEVVSLTLYTDLYGSVSLNSLTLAVRDVTPVQFPLVTTWNAHAVWLMFFEERQKLLLMHKSTQILATQIPYLAIVAAEFLIGLHLKSEFSSAIVLRKCFLKVSAVYISQLHMSTGSILISLSSVSSSGHYLSNKE